MQIINRKTNLVSKTNTAESGNVQASFNSDGRIVLRTFYSRPNEDELIVLSQQETTAIFTLFKKLKVAATFTELPF